MFIWRIRTRVKSVDEIASVAISGHCTLDQWGATMTYSICIRIFLGHKRDWQSINCYCCCFSHSAYWLPTRKNTLHGDQSRSWSAEQGKRSKKISLAAPPPIHTHNKGRVQQTEQREQMTRRASRDASTYLGAAQVSVRLVPVQGFLRLVD